MFRLFPRLASLAVYKKCIPGKKFPAFLAKIVIKSRCFSSFSSPTWKIDLFPAFPARVASLIKCFTWYSSLYMKNLCPILLGSRHIQAGSHLAGTSRFPGMERFLSCKTKIQNNVFFHFDRITVGLRRDFPALINWNWRPSQAHMRFLKVLLRNT